MIGLSGYLVFCAMFAMAVALPGPGIAALIARTLSHGVHAGFLVALGSISGSLVWLTITILGLAAIAKTFAAVFLTIKYIGAAYLLYLAIKLWRLPAKAVVADGAKNGNRKLSSYWIGLSVTLSNPKIIMFYMAILPTLVDIDRISSDLYFVLTATVACCMTIILSSYVLLAAGIKQAFRKGNAVRALQRGTSVIMAGAAALIVAR